MHLLILNGALRGHGGTTSRALDLARTFVPAGVDIDTVDLARFDGSVTDLVAKLDQADAFLVGTGVYWSSWGSPLQRFIEVVTALEATPTFVGKPVAGIVTLDGVGGSDVAARIVTTFNLFGCVVPPFAMAVLSRVGVAASRLPGFEDLWQPEDLRVVVDNLLDTARLRPVARPSVWSVTPLTLLSGPYPAPGALELGSEQFLRAGDG